mgnify:CR=1 FL=1
MDDTYQVQTGVDEIDEWSEEKLRKKLRKNDVSGLELCRKKGDEEWTPLYELPFYLDEVPGQGDPKDVARRRVAQGFTWHVIAFMTVVGTFTLMSMSPPFWALFWAIGLFAHGANAAPAIMGLAQEGKLLSSGSADAAQALPPAGEADDDVTARKGASKTAAHKRAHDALDDDAAHIKSLLHSLDLAGADALAANVDELVEQIRELMAHEHDLDAVLSDDERQAVQRELDQALAALVDADEADHALFSRQVDALQARLQSMDDAKAASARLQAHKSMAIHQLKGLRLELTQAQATGAQHTNIAERLADMRVDVEAAEEVQQVLLPNPVGPIDRLMHDQLGQRASSSSSEAVQVDPEHKEVRHR